MNILVVGSTANLISWENNTSTLKKAFFKKAFNQTENAIRRKKTPGRESILEGMFIPDSRKKNE